jgi:large repetitive protein
MSSAIDFAVRTAAGGTTYGNVAGAGNGGFIQTGMGDSLSLNISPRSVIGYTRSGSDLLIELADGRTIRLADWFDAADVPKKLYLSSDGMISEVVLTEGTNGTLIPAYSLAAGGEKWSPLDDLRFGDSDPVVALAGTGEDDPAGMGIFAPALLGLGGLGAAGAAIIGGGIIIGGGGGGGGGPTHTRSIDGNGTTTTITTNTNPPAIEVTGTGVPGESVAVSIGAQTQTVTVQPDGTWTAGFSGNTLPTDGNHTATAVFGTGSTTTTLTGGTYVIDMTPPNVAVTEGTQSTGDLENLADYADGVTLRGTSEAGATVTVTLGTPGTPDAITRNAEMNPDGTWSITFTQQEIAGGERTQTVTIVATDRLGNIGTPLTEVIELDTIAPPLSVNAVAGNNLVNKGESEAPVIIGGTTAANGTVTLTIQGFAAPITVIANDQGVWSHAIAENTLTDGTYSYTARTVDAAGNPTERTGSFRVDTQMSVAIDADFAGDDVVNLRESQGVLTLTGTVPTDATRVEVQWLGQTYQATLNGNGTWSVPFPAGTAAASQMSEIRVTAWDAADNSHAATLPVRIDLETALSVEQSPVGDDRILSGAEQRMGFTLDGQGEAGARVYLNLNGTDFGPVLVPDSGIWSYTFTSADLQGLTHGAQATITAYAIDAADNQSRTETRSFTVDTQVGNFTFAAPDLTGAIFDGPRDASVLNAAERSAGLPIQGTVEPGAVVTIRVAETNWSTTIPADQTRGGVWTFTLPADALPEGAARTATIIATAIDDLGNAAPPQTQTVAIDTQMSVAIDAGFARDGVVNLEESKGELILTGTAPLDTARVEVQWLGQTFRATVNGDGTWSMPFPAGTATMTQNSTITVTAWDTAGNSNTAERPVRIDLETALSLEQFPVGNDQILSGSEQRQGFILDGQGEAGARVYLNLNGTDFGPVLVPDSGIWSYTFTSADLQGLTHGTLATITAYAIDAAGNQSRTETRSFTVDTQVGDFTFAAPDLTGAIFDGPRDASVLNAAERSAGLPIQGTVEPGATVTIRVAETNWSTTIPADQTRGGIWTFTLPADALPEGAARTATIIATATDEQGNTSPEERRSIAIDTVVADFNAADIRLGTGNDNILNAREHTLGLPVSGRAEPGATIVVTMNGHTERVTANDEGIWSVTFTSDQIPTGDRSNIPVQVTATDTAGNVSGPFTATFAVDTIAPGTPTVIAAEDVAGGYRAITTTSTNDIYSFTRIDDSGAARPIAAQESPTIRGEDRFDFATDIPDGSYLVINTRDLAGNEANTLFIKNTATGVSVDLTREGLAQIDLSAIDLTRAPDARLTITAEQLEALTGPDKTLLIKGESTDTVTLSGVTSVQHNQVINGGVYDIYTLGDNGARVILEDDVSRIPI